MNALVGFLVIHGSIAAVLLGGLWLFFSHVGRLHNLTPWQGAKNYVRKDLDAGPLTQWRATCGTSAARGLTWRGSPKAKATAPPP